VAELYGGQERPGIYDFLSPRRCRASVRRQPGKGRIVGKTIIRHGTRS